MNRIKLLREELLLTQQALADKIGGAKSTIAMYESGNRIPSVEVLNKFSEIFNCSIDYILGNSNIRNDKNISNNKNIKLIPVVGKISAGEPILCDENIEQYLPISMDMYNISNINDIFFLRVQGESMNKTIPNGSFVLVKKQEYAEDNDLIVAIVNGDDEATLKRFKTTDNSQFVTLIPESSFNEFTPRIINLKEDNFSIIGKVIGKFERL